jgi:hypothetical protein
LLAAAGALTIDPVTLLIGVAGGAAAGLLISYVVFYQRPKTKVRVVQRDPETGRMRRKTITTDELDSSKREMRTLILERDLLSSALTKIYEAESDGRITREERELIARRYSGQIRDLEAKLRDKELIVEVGELEKLRDELVSLFREKIQNIESRLDQAKEMLQPVRPEPRVESSPAKPLSTSTPSTDELERVVVERKAPKKDETEGEKRVKILRDEVMDALLKLEQVDAQKEEGGEEEEAETIG